MQYSVMFAGNHGIIRFRWFNKRHLVPNWFNKADLLKILGLGIEMIGDWLYAK